MRAEEESKPAVDEQEATGAVAEGAGEEVGFDPVKDSVATPPPDTPTPAGAAPFPPSSETETPGVSGEDGSDTFAEHPEYFVGGAFAAGLVLAQILRRLRRE